MQIYRNSRNCITELVQKFELFFINSITSIEHSLEGSIKKKKKNMGIITYVTRFALKQYAQTTPTLSNSAAIGMISAIAADAAVYWAVFNNESSQYYHDELLTILECTVVIDTFLLFPIWFPAYFAKKCGKFVYSEYIRRDLYYPHENDPLW